MFYIQFIVNLHNPEEFEFNYKKTTKEDFLVNATTRDNYFEKATRLFEDKKEVILLDSVRETLDYALVNNGEYMYWDYLNKEQEKFFRAYTFMLSHTVVPDTRPVLLFEPSQGKTGHHIYLFNIKDVDKHFKLIENMLDSNSDITDKYKTYIHHSGELDSHKRAEKTLFLKFKSKDKVIRQYTFLLEQ